MTLTSMGNALADLVVAGRQVASYRDGSSLDRTLSPRPFLHPVTTLSGTVVTDVQPEDHRWHLGVSVAVQDAGGVNVWGGRTYLRGQGYTWRDDHGTIRHRGWHRRSGDLLDEDLAWCRPDGDELLTERRVLAARQTADGWALDVEFTLHNDTGAPIPLGSPATNGREKAGYGGLFWRLPLPAGDATVFTPDAVGEAAVHESRSRWLAYHGDDGDPARTFTLVLGPTDDRTAEDRWFVRLDDYPGLCSALATHEPLRIGPGESQTRRLTALVCDGHLSQDRIEQAWQEAVNESLH